MIFSSGAIWYGFSGVLKEKQQEKSKQEFFAYEQKYNDDGIAIDMRDNPIFLEKLDDYEYLAKKLE